MTTRFFASKTASMALLMIFGYPCFAGADLPSINGPDFKKPVKKRRAAVPTATPTLKTRQILQKVAPIVTDPARETSIDRIVVGLFRANTPDKAVADTWNKNRVEIQKAFVAILNERSYLEAVGVNKDFILSESKDVISSEAQRDGVDGALVGEFRGKSIELAIRSGATGRTMARMSVPIQDVGTAAIREVVGPAVDQVILSFPYRGFVIARQGTEVKLNLGRAQGIKPDTLLEIDDLEGEFPNFSSPSNKIGIVKVTKLANNAAIGVIVSQTKPIRPYAKVSFSKGEDKGMEEQLYTRYHQGLWFSLGAEFYYIDTEVSNTNINSPLAKRIYQIPLSPALGVGLGYSRLAMMALVSGLTNASNNVSLLSGSVTYELMRPSQRKLSYITSAGFYYANYAATQAVGSLYPLDSVTTYSGLIEEKLQYVTSPQTKLFGSVRAYLPIFSSDPDNGKSVLTRSFGGGFDLGIRLDLSKLTAVEGGIQMRDLYIGVPSGDTINEFEYGFFAHLLFRL